MKLERWSLDFYRLPYSKEVRWSNAVEREGVFALLELVGTMARAQTLPHVALRAEARCTRCSSTLKTVHNRTRWGESLHLECRRGHGAYQSFAQFLQEKGLLRPMSLT